MFIAYITICNLLRGIGEVVMRNKKISTVSNNVKYPFKILSLVTATSLFLSSCGFLGEKETENEAVLVETETDTKE